MVAVVLVVAPYATKTGRIRALPPFPRSSRRVPAASPFLRQVPRQPELAFAASSSSSNQRSPKRLGFLLPSSRRARTLLANLRSTKLRLFFPPFFSLSLLSELTRSL